MSETRKLSRRRFIETTTAAGAIGAAAPYFVPAKGRQALQAQIQNGSRLDFRQTISALHYFVTGFTDQFDQGGDIGGGPLPFHQGFAGSLSIGGKLTFSDDLDLALTTEWIQLRGELQIGTEARQELAEAA